MHFIQVLSGKGRDGISLNKAVDEVSGYDLLLILPAGAKAVY